MLSYVVNVTPGIVVPIHLTQSGELCSHLFFLMELPVLQDRILIHLGSRDLRFLLTLWTLPQEKPQVGRFSHYAELC